MKSVRHLTWTAAAAAMMGLALGAPSVQAQTPEAFYKGKQVRLIVASGSGGGYDTYSRVLARFMPNHVPGKPTFVVQNMDGAGGLKGTNYVYAVAPKDGTVFVSTYNALTTQPLIDKHGVEYDALKFNWIGSMGKQQQICVTMATSPIKTIQQAMTRELTVSATGATGNSATLPKMLNELIGTKFKVVLGYGTNEQRLAVERGEVDGVCGLSYTTLIASNPDWILNKKINILLQTGEKPHPDMANVPLAIDLVKKPEDKAIVRLYALPGDMGRPYAAPPDVPKDRVEALRRAFDATMKDKTFLVEAEKAHLEIDPVTGEEMDKLLKEAYSAPPAAIKRMSVIMGGGK
jgi:tripartite-type tricarboxylate transporter receptor subunit TctC